MVNTRKPQHDETVGLNPALGKVDSVDYNGPTQPPPPIDTVSVRLGGKNVWPMIWYLAAAGAIILALIYLL